MGERIVGERPPPLDEFQCLRRGEAATATLTLIVYVVADEGEQCQFLTSGSTDLDRRS